MHPMVHLMRITLEVRIFCPFIILSREKNNTQYFDFVSNRVFWHFRCKCFSRMRESQSGTETLVGKRYTKRKEQNRILLEAEEVSH